MDFRSAPKIFRNVSLEGRTFRRLFFDEVSFAESVFKNVTFRRVDFRGLVQSHWDSFKAELVTFEHALLLWNFPITPPDHLPITIERSHGNQSKALRAGTYILPERRPFARMPKLQNVDFIRSTLSGELPTFVSSRSRYLHSTFLCATVAHAHFIGDRFTSVRFEGCLFVGVRFSLSKFRNCTFVDCRFVDCTFNEASFRGTSLSGTYFDGCSFLGAKGASVEETFSIDGLVRTVRFEGGAWTSSFYQEGSFAYGASGVE